MGMPMSSDPASSSADPATSTELVRRRLVWLALAVVVVLAYVPALDGPFVYDDKVEVIGNRAIRVFENWRAVLGYNVSRPLLVLSFAFDWQRASLDPRAYHITSLVIHCLSIGAAVFFGDALARLVGARQPWHRAVAAAALWAIHPMASESVAYITGRSEALCGAFVFLALGAHAEAIQAERSFPWRLLSWMSFLGGVLSKEVAVMLPVAFVGMEVLARGLQKVRWAWHAPLFVGALGAVGLRWSALGEGASIAAMIPAEVDRPLLHQLTTSAEVWIRYVQLWLVPVGQTLFHDQAIVEPMSVRGGFAWVGWAGLVGLGMWAARRWPAAAIPLLFAGLFLVPSTSIARLKEPMAEHRAYQMGLYLWLALVLAIPDRWWNDRRLRVVGGLVFLLAMGATYARASVWQDEGLLWREAAERSPDSADAWFGVGDAHRFAKDCTSAIPAYERALDLSKDSLEQDVPRRLDALNNLGICQAQLGDALAARRTWLNALEIRPSYCKAHTNLGSLAYRQQRWEDALVELRSALAYCPENTTAHWLTGNLYYGPLRDPQKALLHYETLVRLDPRFDYAPQAKERILELTW